MSKYEWSFVLAGVCAVIGCTVTAIEILADRCHYWRKYRTKRDVVSEPLPEGTLRRTVTLPSRCKHCGRDQ